MCIPAEFCIEGRVFLQDHVRLRSFVWKDAEIVRFFAHSRTHVRLCDYVHQ